MLCFVYIHLSIRQMQKKEVSMAVWMEWWKCAGKMRGSCSRKRTFYWLLLIGFSIRDDLIRVSSFIRCIGLHECYYDRILDFFHSSSLNVLEMSRIWAVVVAARQQIIALSSQHGKSNLHSQLPSSRWVIARQERNQPIFLLMHSTMTGISSFILTSAFGSTSKRKKANG